jgi:dihydrofolate synthase/folylpolyglutamate synthase
MTFSNVKDAYQQALSDAHPEDFIFVGGSSYLVADLLTDFTY